MVAIHEIHTARLGLRPLAATDAATLHRLWTHPDVRRFLWDDEIIPAAQTATVIGRSVQLFREHGFGLWGAHLLGGDALMGFCGYWYFRDPPELELLYGIAADHWGQGYATEVARALLRYGFEQLALPAIRGSTDAANVASARVMEKAGMRFDKRAVVGGLDTVFFELRRDAFAGDDAPYRLQSCPV
jgi:ribosomal-protein-alanine N-acetyltransferase